MNKKIPILAFGLFWPPIRFERHLKLLGVMARRCTPVNILLPTTFSVFFQQLVLSLESSDFLKLFLLRFVFLELSQMSEKLIYKKMVLYIFVKFSLLEILPINSLHINCKYNEIRLM